MARQIGWWELMEACIHVVGAPGSHGLEGCKPTRCKGTGGPLISDRYQLSLTPTRFILDTPQTIMHDIVYSLLYGIRVYSNC
jgi:hypothetical protein